MSSQANKKKTMCHSVPQPAAYQQSAGSVIALFLAASASLQNSAPQFHHHLLDNSGLLICTQNHVKLCSRINPQDGMSQVHNLACRPLSYELSWTSSVHSQIF
jgi:hypothetical protein